MANKEKVIKIIDNSKDQNYFTMLPNYILNHSTGDEQALYAQMKRFAGDTGECFTPQTKLAAKLKWDRKKVGLIVQKLLKREWIKLEGTKVTKTHPINVYVIVDLWQLNAEYYRKRYESKRLLSTKKKKDMSQIDSLDRSRNGTYNKNPIKKNKLIDKSINAVSTKTAKRKDFKIPLADYKELVGAYQHFKGVTLCGAEFGPVKQAIKTMIYSGRTKDDIFRFMRWASGICKDMVSDDKIERKFGWMKNWTIITIKRKLPEFLAGKFSDDEVDITIPEYALKRIKKQKVDLQTNTKISDETIKVG